MPSKAATMTTNERPRWQRMPLAARVLAVLLYLLVAVVLVLLIVIGLTWLRYLFVQLVMINCGP
jgi:hypothetical protein